MRICRALIPALVAIPLHAQTKPKPSAAPPTGKPAVSKPAPSLDALVQRANAYWRLLAQKQKVEASAYVEPSCRNIFLGRPFPPFRNPQIKKLEPNVSGTEVAVTVSVVRNIPPLPAPVDYPVTNQWVYKEGRWFVIVKDDETNLFSTLPGATSPALSAEEVQKRKSSILEALKFKESSIDVGTIRQGIPASFKLNYELSGNQAFGVSVRRGPRGLRGLPDRKLLPGAARNIELSFPTSEYDGPFDEALTLGIESQGVEADFDFRLRGHVYTPLSMKPRVVRFRRGEIEKKVEIVNNSSSPATLKGFFSETLDFDITPLPQTLPPGGKAEIAIHRARVKQTVNYVDDLILILAEPVDGMNRLHINVVSNFVENQPKGFGGLTPKEIDELRRKSKPAGVQP